MFELLLAPETLPFTVALTVMFVIAFIEGVGTLLGFGVSSLVDSILPDFDIPDLDIDLGTDSIGTDLDTPSTLIASPGAFGQFLSWLRVGKVPALILLIVFLVGFGLSGLFIQQTLYSGIGFMLPAFIAIIPAFFAALPFVRVCGGALHAIIPKDETDAVSSDSFIGRMAVLTLGDASQGTPASAKVRDQHGKEHYIHVVPDEDETILKAGSTVLLVKKDGNIFSAIHPENKALDNGA
ncbi:MAG: YqiJ family protein [Alphaproteobacteria bacterium]